EPRRAGVNAFGFGGINAHAILEEHTTNVPVSLQRKWALEVIIVDADSRQELASECSRIAEALQRLESAELVDVAWTQWRRFASRPWCIAFVASNLDDLRKKLAYAVSRFSDSTCARIRDPKGIYFFAESFESGSKVAFLFPGEG